MNSRFNKTFDLHKKALYGLLELRLKPLSFLLGEVSHKLHITLTFGSVAINHDQSIRTRRYRPFIDGYFGGSIEGFKVRGR
jgi:hypothetical protein